MGANMNVTGSTPKRILLIVANPSVSTTVGGPVGFWASELTHAWYEFVEHGYDVEIASPRGGKVEFDAYSDPRDPSGYSAHDLISMGFIHTPQLMAQLETTKSLEAVKASDYDAIVVAGGQSPMFTFPTEAKLHKLMCEFYEAEKPTAALCHGTSALLYVKLCAVATAIRLQISRANTRRRAQPTGTYRRRRHRWFSRGGRCASCVSSSKTRGEPAAGRWTRCLNT